MINARLKTILFVCIIPLLFLIVGIATLSDYGISWDEQFHFNRGQAYLHYFLTGKKDFLDLPAYPFLRGTHDFVDRAGESELYLNSEKSKEKENFYRRSYYQSDVFNTSLLLGGFDGGHPPTSDILAAFSNYVFYQKLDILGDIEAYHLYEIVVSALLVLGIGIFVCYNFGKLPALIASLSLALYPLFFAESHFNIKDPTQASFFGLALITFYFGIIKKKWILILLFSVFTGLALGTKFNAVFIPLIILLWLAFYFWYGYSSDQKRVKNLQNKIFRNIKLGVSRGVLVCLFFSPVVSVGLLFAFWPFLWQNPWGNLLSVVNYYQGIGIGIAPELEKYIVAGWNTYPMLWIVYTTPLPILTLSLAGIVTSVRLIIWKKNSAAAFALFWLLVVIGRVTWPGTNIYGGVRQIMEYIPALAILSGIGTFGLLQHGRSNQQLNRTIVALVLLSFLLIGCEVVKLHPNQNVYFNQLVGGLSGAKEKDIPSWGNTYGNIYLQGVEWLNENAEPNAYFGLPIANMVNVPRIKLRPDIYFSNSYPSGPARQGEYVMEMSHDWPPRAWYGFRYYDTFLEPIYEVKVDGVPLLKIWKNDLAHTKPGFEAEREYSISDFKVEGRKLTVDVGREIFLTRAEISHATLGCENKQIGGYIRLSTDGTSWFQEPETIDYPQIPVRWLGSDEDTFVFLFTAKKATSLLLDTEMESSCILKNPEIRVFGVEELP